MEKISRKEAFDCTLALYATIINAVNEEKEKLYDYALILQKNSLSPIICLKPGKYFEWNGSDSSSEKTYAFIPIFHKYITEAVLKHCGTDSEYYDCIVSFEKFDAYNHPCPWIKETLTKKYLELFYWRGTLMDNKLEYDSSLLSKTHSTWVCAKVDDVTIYFPYYTQKEREKAFNKLGDFHIKMTQQYWEELS